MQLSYIDMVGLMQSDIPTMQWTRGPLHRPSAEEGTALPERRAPLLRPLLSHVRGSVPIRLRLEPGGRPGSRSRRRAGQAMNQRLFGGEDSVGRTLRIEDREFRVVGVLDRWRRSPSTTTPTAAGGRRRRTIYVPSASDRRWRCTPWGTPRARTAAGDLRGVPAVGVPLDPDVGPARHWRSSVRATVPSSTPTWPGRRSWFSGPEQPAPRRDGLAALPEGRAR